MRVVVIGGTGHVGTYLVPRLVEAGHGVVVLTRGQHEPYRRHAAWEHVQRVVVDRPAEEASDAFGRRVLELRPDVVIDAIAFRLVSVQRMVEALRGSVQQYVFVGTIWVHGHSTVVPTTEEQPRKPFGDYGIQKAAAESYLLEQARRSGFPATIVHPGHIVGPGWEPINPAGYRDPRVFEVLARGEELALPNLGLETLHHVHADDVAQVIVNGMTHWSNAVGQSFHAVSPAALTLRGYAEAVAGWFGRAANLRFLPFEEWKGTVLEESAAMTWDHIAHSPCCSIVKAQRLLEYQPRYTSLQAVYESVSWLIDNGVIDAPPLH
jgi:nucleoside-diphosphate-sugar epimerase